MSEESPNAQYKRLLNQTKAKPYASKYGNEPVVRDGVTYDSKAEYTYKGVLDMQVKAGQITGYDHHVKIPLVADGGKLVGYYEADYLVYTLDGQQVHDVKSKGSKTALFDWKARHYRAQYGNPIILIDSKTLKPVAKL